MGTLAPTHSAPSALIVEDEPLIGMEMESILRGLGFDTHGPFASPRPALEDIEKHAPTVAMLDIDLGQSGYVWPVAEKLADMGVPFIFVTAYPRMVVPSRFRDHVLISKPVCAADLEIGLLDIGAPVNPI